MTMQEWDECFIWLVSLFPAWSNQVTKITSAVWYDEVGKFVSKAVFKNSVRAVMLKDGKPFPPGIPEILAMLTADETTPPAEMIWEQIWQSSNCIATLPTAAKKALDAMGGYQKLAMVDTSALRFLKKTFIESYNHFLQKDALEIQSSKILKLKDRQSSAVLGFSDSKKIQA